MRKIPLLDFLCFGYLETPFPGWTLIESVQSVTNTFSSFDVCFFFFIVLLGYSESLNVHVVKLIELFAMTFEVYITAKRPFALQNYKNKQSIILSSSKFLFINNI